MGSVVTGGFAEGRPAGESHADRTDSPDGGSVREFTIHAIPVDIVYNRNGQHQPEGAMFVLEENVEAAREASGQVPGDAFADLPDHDGHGDEGIDTSVIQPLVVRASVGDVIEVEFVNHLDQYASIHQTGLPYEVETSDGMSVGFNEDTTVPPGESTTYRWYATHQGTHYFRDGVSQAFDSTPSGNTEKVNNLARGLFGAVVVEPKGATWTDPETGGELRSGVRADVHDPEGIGTSYREFVVFYHDPGEVLNADGTEPTWQHSEVPQMTHGINYRGDKTGVRVEDDCPDCSEENFYSSWVHGDPGGGDNVYETYVGDPVKMVAVGANLEENHSHHLHNHRWKEIPGDTDSDTIDAQSLGPGGAYEAYLTVGHGRERFDTSNPEMTWKEAFEVGIGSEHGTVGDVLFHCHLFPHYAEGMNGLVRINDKEQEDLQPLPNNAPPLPEDSDVPGFPEFVPGERGRTPPERPDNRELTADEREALDDDGVPGAPYADPCTEGDVQREIEYTLVALPTNIVYNDSGDHDPDGATYVVEEANVPGLTDGPVTINDIEKLRNGEMNPEPLVIRANVGDCVTVTLRNEQEELPISIHPHFVRYDLQGSDSLNMGYNYEQNVQPGEEEEYRWFADEEGTIFFHDHSEAIMQGMHGAFCTLVVEPTGSKWFDPYSGDPLPSGTQAMIQTPEGQEDFREQALLYHDFAALKKRDSDEFVEPARAHNQNAGVMAINYRNAPYYHRDDADPAYLHSSYVHGDPETPVIEAYEGDEIRLRLVAGPWEEQHTFQAHGLDLKPFGRDSRDVTGQILNISEAFTFRIRERAGEGDPLDNPSDLPVRDYLYGSGITDDIWNGMWGLVRYWGQEVDHLRALPDRETPDGHIPEDDLREMGHPAPFSDLDWTEYGQRATLYYDGDDDRTFPPDKDARQNGCIDETPPEQADHAGRPCSEDATVRTYDVTAIQTDIPYNDYGDHDPHGIVFAPDEHVEDVLDGKRLPEPLTIRANEGDCVEVNLTNKLRRQFYQVDLVVGAPEEKLGESPEDFYSDEERLVRAAHGSTDDAVTRHVADHDHALADGFESSIDSDPVEIDDGVASVRFTVQEGRELDLSFASYEKPGPSFSRHVSQELYAATSGTFGPGTHTLTVRVPDGSEALDDDHAHPEMRAERDWEQSDRISLHPTRITYDVQGSDGATVGFNFDQTAGPDDTVTYRWYADERTDGCTLYDMADLRGHRHHGAYGQLVTEPAESTWLDPETGEPLSPPGVGSRAIVVDPNGEDFREFALTFADGQHVVNPDGSCVVPPNADDHEQDPENPCNRIGDPEDQGYVGINYRSEPFARRFETNDAQHLVFNSYVHGDPNTPVLDAYRDDPVVFRTCLAADKPRGLAFHLANHQWGRFRGVEDTAVPVPRIGVDDDVGPGKCHDVAPIGGAGGLADQTGDFIYQAMKLRRRLEAGWWGIFRVRGTPDDFQDPVHPLPDRSSAYSPSDRPGWETAWGDVDGDGRTDLLVGVPESDGHSVNAGAAYLFTGAIDADDRTDLASADVRFVGERAGERAGATVALDDSTIAIETSPPSGKGRKRYVFDGRRPLGGTVALSAADEVVDLSDD